MPSMKCNNSYIRLFVYNLVVNKKVEPFLFHLQVVAGDPLSDCPHPSLNVLDLFLLLDGHLGSHTHQLDVNVHQEEEGALEEPRI